MDSQPDSHKDKDNGETEQARHSNRQTEMERKMGRVRDKERLGESEVDEREMWIEGKRERCGWTDRHSKHFFISFALAHATLHSIGQKTSGHLV